MVWTLLRVAFSSVGISPPIATTSWSGGCGRLLLCSDQCNQLSPQAVPFGGSELLSWTVKWHPNLTIIPLSFPPMFFKSLVDS